jgi:hypothetical protein
VDGVGFIKMGIRENTDADWHYLLLPAKQGIGLKGGPPGAILDIIAGFPQSVLGAEFPPNDIDIIATGNEEAVRRISRIMGVDPNGVEMFSREDLEIDFTLYCLGRDTTQNQVYWDARGLHYSDDAHLAAQTGGIEIIGQYIGGRAIYGIDIIYLGGIKGLVTPRGMMRQVKAVVEGKAMFYYYLLANSVIDLGIYWLVLARKWSKRDCFGDHMQKMYYLGKQMNQVQPGENNIYDVLTRVHETYPFFDFASPPMDMVGIARWKAGKLIKQADREFGWKYHIPSDIEFSREKEQLTLRSISLKGVSPSDRLGEKIMLDWQGFLARCQERTDEFYKTADDGVNRFFTISAARRSGLDQSVLDQYEWDK